VSGCEHCRPRVKYPRLRAIHDALVEAGYDCSWAEEFYGQVVVDVEPVDVAGYARAQLWLSEFDNTTLTCRIGVGVSESGHASAVTSLADRLDTVRLDEVRERVRDIERIVQATLVAAEVA